MLLSRSVFFLSLIPNEARKKLLEEKKRKTKKATSNQDVQKTTRQKKSLKAAEPGKP